MDEPTTTRSDDNWAKPIDKLAVGNVPAGALDTASGQAGRLPDPGLREDVAEDVPRRAHRRQRHAAGAHRDLEGGVPDLLAEGQPVLRAAHGHRAGRGRAAAGVASAAG